MSEEPLSKSEKTHYTNLWCREQGIKSRDLTEHDQIDECILLINFRNEFWLDMNQQQRGYWAAYWNRTYHRQFSLKDKHFRQLEAIINSVLFQRQQQQKRRQTIQVLRSKLNQS